MMDLARSGTIPFLQRAIASHFLFEYTHPFYDGNGRTGRYLLALYLSHDLTLPTVLSLSRTIAENKNEYYKAFTEAEDKLNSGELTFFVYTILGLIERAQESLIEELGVKIDQLDKATVLRDELRREHALSTNATLLLYAVMQEELFDTTKSMTLEDAGGDLMLTKQTIRKYVDELAGASLIEFTGRRLSDSGPPGRCVRAYKQSENGGWNKMPLCFLWQILSDISKPANKNCHIAKSPG